MNEYYSILGLEHGASQEDIKKSYRTLSKKYHPDLNPGDEESEEKFKKVVEAYEVLTGKQKPKVENPFAGNPFNTRSYKARPIKLFVELTLEEAYHGVSKEINYTIKDTCKKCSGDGGFEPIKCNQCDGSGHIQQGPFIFTCNNCNGNGKFYKNVCYSCQGQGHVKDNTTVNINIPRGTTDDTIFNYPNAGDNIKGAERGDVYLVIKIKNHKDYTLEGLNLKRKLDVPFLDIILGTETEFDTLDGKVKIKIPKLSEMNKTFRLRGKGFTDGSTNISGDLYVTLNPILPKQLNNIEEDKLRQLKTLPNFI
jgi:molecular chaperone DnaJ